MERENMEDKEIKIIQNTTKELLDLLNIKADLKIAKQENDKGADIALDTEDGGIVIGYHGDMLEALQLVLSLCVAKRIGRFVRISIEVGDYKKNRTDWLKNLALQTKENVLLEKREIVLPQLKSWERRIIHLLLQEDKEVISQSQGEGRDRVLVVSPRG